MRRRDDIDRFLEHGVDIPNRIVMLNSRSDDDGDEGGNGEFDLSENEENCESWVAYIAAIP